MDFYQNIKFNRFYNKYYFTKIQKANITTDLNQSHLDPLRRVDIALVEMLM